jgi:hypothetical protein
MSIIHFTSDEKTNCYAAVMRLQGDVSAQLYLDGIQALRNEFLPYVRQTLKSMYQLDIIVHDEEITEEEFWRRAILTYGLIEPAIHYQNEVVLHSQSHRPIWLDEENPAAHQVSLELAKHSHSFVPLYTAYLQWHDMDHEVAEAEDIEALIDRYGWSEQTLDLAAMRIGIACGQEGRWQFEKLVKDKGLRAYLEENDLLEPFIYQRFLEKYLDHYGDLMKSTPHFHWPLSYCLDSVSDLLEELMDEEAAEPIYAKCQAIAEAYYEKHGFE